MTDQAINYRKKNATWHKIIDAGIAVKIKTKRKKKMTHALKILSIKKEHTYVRLHCKYRHHTVHEPLPPNSQVHTTKIRCSEVPLIIVISCHFTLYIRSTIRYPPIKFKIHTLADSQFF